MALQGFDEAYYLGVKLAALQATYPEWLGKTTAQLKTTLANLGYTPEQHYMKFGYQEKLGPNAYFNGDQYTLFKAKALFDSGAYVTIAAAKEAFLAAWKGNVYEHYLRFGGTEGVDPSNAFDSSAYLATKLAALKIADPVKYASTTTADVAKAIADAGLTPLTHYLAIGKSEANVSVTAVPVGEQVNPESASNPGQSFTLTTGVDIVKGTSGDDTIIGDNTGATKQLSAADQLDAGTGTDTLKVFLAAADTSTGQPSTLTGIENVWINGGVIAAYTAGTGTTGLTIEAPVLTGGALTAATYTLAGQAVTLKDAKVTANSNTTFTSTTDTSQSFTLNGWTKSGAAVTNTIDLAGTKVASATFKATGAASNIVLTNTGTALTSLTLAGDKDLSIKESLDGVKTINASTATGKMSVDVSGATLNAAFAFTGGSGNDTLAVKAGALGLLTAGSQLDGGTGTDALFTKEVAVLTAAQVAKVNATKGFEVLGFEADGSGVDVSTVTGISQFKVAAGNYSETFTNANSSSKFIIDNQSSNTGTIAISNKVGETATSVTLDTGATTTAQTLAVLTLTGLTNVALESTGSGANIITTLNNADNSAIKITGAADLTLATKATAIGSKVDGSAATGKLTITGNNTAYLAGSSLGDTLIGGSANDTIKASVNNATLTGNGGSDTFDVSVALGGVASLTTITDLVKADVIKFKAGAGIEVFTKTKVDVSAATTAAAALDLAAAGDGSANGIIKWFQYDSNTYIVADNTAGAAFAVTDQAIKLTGTLDLSTSTYDAAANTLTYA